MQTPLAHIPIIVLCGGQGTRLRSVLPDRPKILAPIGEETLLDTIMRTLQKSGFTNIILSVGYLREHIKAHVRKKKYAVSFSEEDTPLGTGGAIKRAAALIDTDRFFAMNGDTLFRPDFNALYRFHTEKKSALTLMLTRRYQGSGGHVAVMDANNRISLLRPKTADDSSQCALNGGTYLIERATVERFPSHERFSLEDDAFPRLFSELFCYGLKTHDPFIDIGVPERYALAQRNYRGFQTTKE